MTDAEIEKEFESAALVLEEAEECLEAFEASADEFAANSEASIIEVPGSAVGHTDILLRLSDLPPPLMRRKAYGVLTHARHFLDQAVCAGITCETGTPPESKIYFPYDDDPRSLDGRLSRTPPKVAAAIRALQPWPESSDHNGGNDALWWVCSSSGKNKHVAIVEADPELTPTHIIRIDLERVIDYTSRPRPLGNGRDYKIASLAPGGTYTQSSDLKVHLKIRESVTGSARDESVLREIVQIARTFQGQLINSLKS